jgi:proline iminopeptidase
MNTPTTPHPPIEPYASGFLDVGDGHRLYWERVGTPGAQPAVFLHGGPGAGFSPAHRRLFDPQGYDVLFFDQRGAGRSTPAASLDANTTAHLVSDIETLRREVMNVPRWLVFGGSWGSTLALAYAQTHVERVDALILRGIFTATQAELDWFYRSGVDQVFPDKWERFIEPIAPAERVDLLQAYRQRLQHGDAATQLDAARAWCRFEDEVSTLVFQPEPDADDDAEADRRNLAVARIENHYFINGCFLQDQQLLREARRLAAIPAVIVHGRYDMPCPAKYAWALHRAWPEAEFHLVEAAGHAYRETGVLERLLHATAQFARKATAAEDTGSTGAD